MPRPPRKPTLLRIPAHHTPHANDPPDAHEFYAALGMFTVAWGRFEGHIIGALLKILAMPEASAISSPIPILWEKWPKRAELWEAAFKTIPSLAPCKDLAIAFMSRVMDGIKDRHFGAHAIWDEFIQAASEPTIRARTIKARKGTAGAAEIIDVTDFEISITLVRSALAESNKLNSELVEFTTFLDSLRPPPPGIRRL